MRGHLDERTVRPFQFVPQFFQVNFSFIYNTLTEKYINHKCRAQCVFTENTSPDQHPEAPPHNAPFRSPSKHHPIQVAFWKRNRCDKPDQRQKPPCHLEEAPGRGGALGNGAQTRGLRKLWAWKKVTQWVWQTQADCDVSLHLWNHRNVSRRGSSEELQRFVSAQKDLSERQSDRWATCEVYKPAHERCCPKNLASCSFINPRRKGEGEKTTFFLILEERSSFHHQLLLHVRQGSFLVPTWSSQDCHSVMAWTKSC